MREEELAKEFGVSRTPIRQVLQILEYEGLVTTRPGIGSIVTYVDIKALKDVYAFRLKLIEIVGELSSPRISDQEIKVLENLLEQTKNMIKNFDPKRLALIYLEFHEQMMKFITNQPLRKVYDQLFHQTARVWLQILPDLNWEEEVGAMYEEIRDVIKALKINDICTMATVRRNHMALLLVRINRYLSSADNGLTNG